MMKIQLSNCSHGDSPKGGYITLKYKFGLVTMLVMAISFVSPLSELCLADVEGQDGMAGRFIGGRCSYEDFRGECEIVSVLKIDDSARQAQTIGGPGYEGFEVRFVFKPDEPMNLSEDREEDLLGKERTLRLCNSWYPGPRFLEKYNITEGAVFDCTLRLITKGTCSPVIFEFDEIDNCDYFESYLGRDAETSETSTEEGANTVKIGAIYSLTGPLASSGEDMKRGILLAAEVINGQYDLDLPLARSEGISSLGGSKVEIVFGDSKGTPSSGMSEAERLIKEELVVALIGSYQSSVTAATSEVAEAEGTPFLTAASTAPSLTQRGFSWFFRTTPDEDIFVQNFYQFLADVQETNRSDENKGTSRLAIVHEDSIWGEEFGEYAKRYAENYGHEIVANISYSYNDTDVNDEVRRLNEADPDVVMQASYTEDAVLYMQTYKEMNFTPKALLADDAGFLDPEFLDVLGKDGEYVLTRATWSEDLAEAKPLAGNVSKIFEDRYGTKMDENSARAFTATFVLVDAIKRAGSTNPRAIQMALLETNLSEDETIMPWEGIEFDQETHQNTKGKGIICQIIGQDYCTVWPFDLASSDLVWPMPAWGERA